ncbi:unnamed protein product [Staurois parvus]|uniref:Uncharacterized protein n=1 Tax=Staurois parvus TaxID=386267 RepID=A0ABN9DXX5_9NEOB|nr:unnamed protein product [Staurois parvus]
MGPRTDSSCCCQARNLSWAPVPRLLMLLPGPMCHGSLYGLPLLLSPSPHTAMCHFSGLLTLLWVPFFIGCCMASHCCCRSTATTVAPHSGFWPRTPRDCPNE